MSAGIAGLRGREDFIALYRQNTAGKPNSVKGFSFLTDKQYKDIATRK